jgi:peptide/nickel transport system substrate-binding protein
MGKSRIVNFRVLGKAGMGLLVKGMAAALLILSSAGLFYFLGHGKFRHHKDSPRYGGTLRIDVVSPITSIDPRQPLSSGSSFVLPLLYSSLVWPKNGGSYEPDLAEQWNSEQDSRIWRFFIRKDARFHDGSPVRPEDVKYSLLQQLLKKGSNDFKGVDEIQCREENEVALLLPEPNPNLLDEIWKVSIVPAAPIDKSASPPLGSGPFRLQSIEGQNKVVLAAFRDYYGGRPYIDSIVFTYVPDSETVWHRMLLGHTDFAHRVSSENELFSRKLSRRFHFLKTPETFITALLYNNLDPLFEEPGVRRALTMALDREYFIKRYLDPASHVASGCFAPESPYHDSSVKPLPYQPEESLRLLKECGWQDRDGDGFLDRQGRTFEFEILAPEGYQEEIKVAREIQVGFYLLGLKVHITVLPVPRMVLERLEPGRFQAALLGLNGYEMNPQEDWRGSPRGAYNYARYCNPRLDMLLETLKTTAEPQAKLELYHEIERILSNDAPASFLYRNTFCSLVSRRIRGFHPEKATTDEFRKLWKSYLVEDPPAEP